MGLQSVSGLNNEHCRHNSAIHLPSPIISQFTGAPVPPPELVLVFAWFFFAVARIFSRAMRSHAMAVQAVTSSCQGHRGGLHCFEVALAVQQTVEEPLSVHSYSFDQICSALLLRTFCTE
jgi:hypothetical protein